MIVRELKPVYIDLPKKWTFFPNENAYTFLAMDLHSLF